MELILLGTGAAWPDAERKGPSFAIIEKGITYLIDCGPGVTGQLVAAGIKPSTVDNVILTHRHIDHCVEFPTFVFSSYLTGKEGKYNVYGPAGIRKYVDGVFNYAFDFADEMMQKIRKKKIDIDVKEINEGVLLENKGLKVECMLVNHSIETLGLKFTTKGKTIVLTGDTAECKELINFSKDADIIVADCSFPEEVGAIAPHMIPSQAGKLAQAANAKKLILVHLFPMCAGKESEMIAEAKKHFNGIVEIGEDLQRLTV